MENFQPCAFIAANYVLLGRLARHIGAGQYLLVNPRRITLVFVSSDIITFLIQVRIQPYSIFLEILTQFSAGYRRFR